MADFNHDISFMKELDPSGRLEAWARRFMESHKNVADQVNAAQVGTTRKPPQINSLTVTGAGGIHEFTIHDNTPVNKGLSYFVEWSQSPNFANPRQETLGPDRQKRLVLGVSGPIYARAYSAYPTSLPSEPVYHGTPVAPTGVDAGGTIVGPPVGASTGSGTESSLLPKASAGFGFDNARLGANTAPRE